MAEASLAVQGINKLRLELNQKDNELALTKEKGIEGFCSFQYGGNVLKQLTEIVKLILLNICFSRGFSISVEFGTSK